MKKYTNNIYKAASRFKASIRQAVLKKTSRYIYTEDDLGDGLLHAGIDSFPVIHTHAFKPVPGFALLRAKAS
jgi:hypothetical protein